MPRTAREKSLTNIFHVMLRGINRQNIFEDDEDRNRFMTILGQCKEISGFKLHAFVLMSNHIHLLIEPAGEALDMIFRRVGTRYAVWFNRKYQRSGHLFQDRFRSECVQDDQYYKTVLRYILQNPTKAGMEKRPGTYRWSSYLAYEKGKAALTDTQYAMTLFENREQMIDYLVQNNDDAVMDESEHDWCIRDDRAKEILAHMTQCTSASDYQQLDSSAQKEYAKALYQNGLSMGQIARLTGMSKTTVHRAVHGEHDDKYVEEDLPLKEAETDSYIDENVIW